MTTFESETCSRCCGSGNYSYCQMYGSTCFRCSGRKITLTRRGAAAKAYYDSLLVVPASEVQVGQTVRVSNGKFYTVTAVGQSENSYIADGVRKSYYDITMGCFTLHTFPAAPTRIGHSNEAKAEFLAKALEFQATLTKQGKPAKVKV